MGPAALLAPRQARPLSRKTSTPPPSAGGLEKLPRRQLQGLLRSSKDRSAILLGGQKAGRRLLGRTGQIHHLAPLPRRNSAWVTAFNAEKRPRLLRPCLGTSARTRNLRPRPRPRRCRWSANFGFTRTFPKSDDGRPCNIPRVLRRLRQLALTENLGAFVERAMVEEELGRHAPPICSR